MSIIKLLSLHFYETECYLFSLSFYFVFAARSNRSSSSSADIETPDWCKSSFSLAHEKLLSVVIKSSSNCIASWCAVSDDREGLKREHRKKILKYEKEESQENRGVERLFLVLRHHLLASCFFWLLLLAYCFFPTLVEEMTGLNELLVRFRKIFAEEFQRQTSA